MPTHRPFRFGVVASQAQSADEWIAKARRVESMGFATLVMPDVLEHVPAVFPALAVAATATTRLRVGTYVLANDYRNPLMTAREASTLDLLSGGRFELGMGAGRPAQTPTTKSSGFHSNRPGAASSGLKKVSGLSKRCSMARRSLRMDSITPCRKARYFPGPPSSRIHRFSIAGTARRILTLAGREADIVGIGGRPNEAADAVEEKIQWVRDGAGGRFDQIELNANLMAVGDRVHPQALQWLGMDEAEVRRSESPFILLGSAERNGRQARGAPRIARVLLPPRVRKLSRAIRAGCGTANWSIAERYSP